MRIAELDRACKIPEHRHGGGHSKPSRLPCGQQDFPESENCPIGSCQTPSGEIDGSALSVENGDGLASSFGSFRIHECAHDPHVGDRRRRLRSSGLHRRYRATRRSRLADFAEVRRLPVDAECYDLSNEDSRRLDHRPGRPWNPAHPRRCARSPRQTCCLLAPGRTKPLEPSPKALHRSFMKPADFDRTRSLPSPSAWAG